MSSTRVVLTGRVPRRSAAGGLALSDPLDVEAMRDEHVTPGERVRDEDDHGQQFDRSAEQEQRSCRVAMREPAQMRRPVPKGRCEPCLSRGTLPSS